MTVRHTLRDLHLKTKRTGYRPLYLLRDLADRLGVDYGKLCAAMKGDPQRPSPVLSTGSPPKRYWCLVEMRTWWKKRPVTKD